MQLTQRQYLKKELDTKNYSNIDQSMKIKTITLNMPFKVGKVNCYLIKTKRGFILIDTGASNKRTELEKSLENAGCNSGNLKLIVLTHGDFDHTGNASHLREKFAAKIAMHSDDLGMVEQGDMFWNRKGNFFIKKIAPSLFGFGKSERFKPDFYLEDEDDLSDYGLNAHVIHIPGHSKGSIGILTREGELFCGDLLENTKKPGLNSIMDDKSAADISIEKLKSLEIKTAYPGHGECFPIDLFIKNYQK